MTLTAPGTRRIHRAWWVAAVTMAALIAAAGFRSSTGALLVPLEEEFGWSRATTSGAVSLNLIIYGLTAPFAAALMERFGLRRVVAVALLLVALGSGLTLVMTEAWQLWLLWGFAVGHRDRVAGAGVRGDRREPLVREAPRRGHRRLLGRQLHRSARLPPGHRPPRRRPRLALGRRRWSPGSRCCWCRSSGWSSATSPPTPAPRRTARGRTGCLRHRPPGPEGAARLALTTLRDSARSRTFWILFATFWICGWSTNGLIGTHFIPAAHDHGMPETTSAGLLALIGIFDIVGTVASGWLTDRVDSRYLLFVYYFFRGLSLLFVPWLLGPHVHPSLFLFILFYGLDWVATVPPTVALCRQHFGIERSGVVFGWVFASHMVGAGVAASYAGWIRTGLGDYFVAWMTAGALCLGAAALCLLIPRRGIAQEHLLAPSETGSL